MKQKPTVVFLGDGMADEPVAELGGRTPLQAAETPGMDRIAREGQSGTLLTLPDGFPTSSDTANMSVLGCDLATEFCGRGVLEAMSRGIPLAKTARGSSPAPTRKAAPATPRSRMRTTPG